jgi:hypothetical protein
MVVERGRSEIEREWLREWVEHTSLCEPSEMDEERSREREREEFERESCACLV